MTVAPRIRSLGILGFIAVISGGSVALFYETKEKGLMQEIIQLRQSIAQNSVAVFYYVKDVPAGTTISAEDFEKKEVEASKCPPDAIDNEWIAVERVSKQQLSKGDLVRFQDFGLAMKKNASKE